jgi:hypothetical protein
MATLLNGSVVQTAAWVETAPKAAHANIAGESQFAFFMFMFLVMTTC